MTPTDESWASWLRDLEQETYNFINQQSSTNVVEPSFPSHHVIGAPLSSGNHSSYTNSSSTMSNSSGDVNSFERPSKTLKTSPSNTGYLPQKKGCSSNSYILSFNNENPQPILNNTHSISTMKPKGKFVNHGRSLENQKKEHPKQNIQEISKKTTHDSVTTRSPHHAQDHIIAERKRREKISQQFIALSALIPNLKKMDKASVLEDAIKHVKELQEKVKVLEEEQSKWKNSLESVVYVLKSKSFNSEEDVSETSSNSGNGNSRVSKKNGLLLEVEARVSDKNVLIQIHCENKQGVLMNIIKEIENLHLSVTTSSTLLFGTSKFDITIIAKMEEEFRLSVQELARNLRGALLQFM